jgi:NAD(P)-dependent dehydrogenase (short-subunit alcohol dehydrogenase family)
MKKIVLITGATRGLGKEIALQSVKAGFITLIGARSKADGEAIVKEFGAKEGLMDAIQLDVTDNDSVIAAAAYIKLQYGKLDVLVNNAGVLDFAESQKISLDVFRSTYRVNVFGVVTMIEQMSPLLRASGQGQIINVSSEVGTFSVMTNPESPYYSLSLPAYITSKSAVNLRVLY